MTRDSLAFAVSGTAFGLLVGWIIGSQQLAPPAPPVPVAATAPASPQAPPAPPPLDQARASELEKRAVAEPNNVAVRLELANLYFDSDRVDDAGRWFEAVLALDPANVPANTDVAIVYFAQGQLDRALAHIDRALATEPRSLKALLYQGIVRWRKQDQAGAAESWERVVAFAPDSEEARTARLGLEGLKGTMGAPGGAGTAPQ